MKTLLARWPRTVATLRLLALGSLALGLGILLGTLAVALDVPQPFLVAVGGAATLLLALITMLQPQLVATGGIDSLSQQPTEGLRLLGTAADGALTPLTTHPPC